MTKPYRKKTYQVELLGRTELANWMVEQSPPAQLREELMVRYVQKHNWKVMQFYLN